MLVVVVIIIIIIIIISDCLLGISSWVSHRHLRLSIAKTKLLISTPQIILSHFSSSLVNATTNYPVAQKKSKCYLFCHSFNSFLISNPSIRLIKLPNISSICPLLSIAIAATIAPVRHISHLDLSSTQMSMI